MAEKPVVPKDPIQTRSLSVPMFIASGVLMATIVLAGYDEFYGRRPYKNYQATFTQVYLNYLDELGPRQATRMDEILASEDYKSRLELLEEAEQLQNAAVAPLMEKAKIIEQNLETLRAVQKPAKSEEGHLRWAASAATSDAKREKIIGQIDELMKTKFEAELLTDGAPVTATYNYVELGNKILALQDEKAGLEKQQAALASKAAGYRKELAALVDKNLDGPTPDSVAKLVDKAESGLLGGEGKSVNDILQIHIGEFDWIDRCESCHAGTREPVDMSVADIVMTTKKGIVSEEKEGALEAVRKYLEENEGMRDSFTYHALHPDASQAVFPDGIARAVNDIRDELRGLTAYTAHPTKELLKIHDPEVFGCSMCHNGNGRSVTSVELAHGLNKYWLYPMHQRENMDAGCVQCHKDDFRLDHGDTFNEAKRLFQNRGCWGCHVYEGFNSQPAEILDLINEDHAIETKLDKMGVQAAVAEPEKRQTISMEMGRLQTRKLEIEGQIVDIRREVQKVGPSLTNLKAKVKQEWILPWLLDPTSYRPTTKMPSFFENLPADLKVEHATAIAAYLWQNADDPATILTETFKKGDPTRGQELFESRGCLGCHTIEKDGQLVGDGFAADLSRIGEKHNYQYTVKWVLEPDNGIMPNLRLSVRDAEDIATYLTGLSTNRNYAPTPQLDNGGLFERGEKYVLHYGCAGCHTIKGLENEKGIGTELTVEGSKPKERLDFGRLEHGFKERKEYTHKHFFENKLRTPGVYGLGKIYDENLDGLDRLKMPNFRLNEPQITALTTMILGSVETPIPETWQYNPTGRDKYVQDGWWVINKYNCMGCHQILPEQEPHLWGLDRYQGMDENNIKPESRRPPTLVSLGARVNPDWLADFLRNPALTHDPATYNGNGVRPYLSIRMPSFRFSEREIQTLVRFFQALDSQPIPYTPPALEPLTPRELEGARALFTGVNCTLCHATGDAEHDKKMSAPKLLVAREKLKHPWTVRWMHDPQSIIPWTGMPQNFPAEQVLTLNNGQQIRGTNYAAPTAKKLGRIKLHSGEEIPVDYGTVNMVESSRHVGSLMPKELDFYEGDYGELMARYLLLHFDEAEFERTKPAK